MELEYTNKNSKRSKVYIGVGLFVALLVAATVFLALQAANITGDVDVEMRTVVVAVNEIPARQPIAEDDVTTRQVAADPTNEDAFDSVDEVIGRLPSVTVSPGQLISANVLASTTEGQTFSILQPGEAFDAEGPDLRAVSVTVADGNAVAGTLAPGQRVDLIVTMTINPTADQPQADPAEPPEFVAGPSTKVTMQSMMILARNESIYILRADLATAEKIAELTAAGGIFTLVLRPEQDDRDAETDGSTIDRLIDEFEFPIPVPPEYENRN